ncbi:hypothetical protein [Agrococcus sp. Marseille-Q4369]|uniref:hypothetical protein n=1 Tax=Agrococcus sp. Marseille-Q4369 TaxID=2810513 RepID=UPI001B8B00FE|nr:hypothetical protein [Agrococcus sp. Marseille-Q4369]QUW18348.1 hypothetical protein JSQ78_11020 [Agrococcus sp. Marseille-Q4369]
MSMMFSVLFSVAGLVLGLLLIVGGIVLLVIGSRRRDDSTSRAPLALGVTLLVIGTAAAVPSLLWTLLPFMA